MTNQDNIYTAFLKTLPIRETIGGSNIVRISGLDNIPHPVYSPSISYVKGFVRANRWPKRFMNKYQSISELGDILFYILSYDGYWEFIPKRVCQQMGSSLPDTDYLPLQPNSDGTFIKSKDRVFWFHANCVPENGFNPEKSYKFDLSQDFAYLSCGIVKDKDLSNFEMLDCIAFDKPLERPDITHKTLKRDYHPYIVDPLL